MRGSIYKISAAILIFIALSASGASAQHYIGLKGGYGGGSSRLYPERDKGTLWGLSTVGVSWKFYTAERVAGGIEVDLLYIQQGFKYPFKAGDSFIRENYPNFKDAPGYYEHSVNSIMLPIFWQPHFYFIRQKLRVFLNAGVTFYYNLDQSYEVGNEDKTTVEGGDKGFSSIRDNRFGYGLCAGGGFSFAFDRWEAVAEFRYYIGYSDIMKNRNKYPQNYFLRTPLDKMEITVGVYYRLGKGGIKSKPGKHTQQKMDEWEARQRAKRGLTPVADTIPPADVQAIGTADAVSAETAKGEVLPAEPTETKAVGEVKESGKKRRRDKDKDGSDGSDAAAPTPAETEPAEGDTGSKTGA